MQREVIGLVDNFFKGCKFKPMKNSNKTKMSRCRKPFFYKNSSSHKLLKLFFVFSLIVIVYIFFKAIQDRCILNDSLFSLSATIVTGFFVSYLTYYFTIFLEKKSINKQFIHKLYFMYRNFEQVYNTHSKNFGKLQLLYEKILSDTERLCLLSNASPMYVSFFSEDFKIRLLMYKDNPPRIKKDTLYFIDLIACFLVSFPDSHDLKLSFNKMKKHVDNY